MIERLLKLEAGPLADAFRACRPHFFYLMCFSAALNVLYLAPSLYMLQIYDRVLVSGSIWTLAFLTIALFVSLSALGLLDAVRGQLLSAAGQRLDRLVAPVLLRAAMDERDPSASGRSRSQPLRDFDVFRAAVAGAPFLAACDLPWTPLFIFVCFVIHPLIGAAVLLGGAVLVAIAFLSEHKMRGMIRRQAEAISSYALLDGDAASAETGRVLGMRDALVARQLNARTGLTTAQSEAAVTASGHTALTKFVRLLLQSGILGLGAYLAVERQISPGGIIAGSIIAARAFAPLEQVVSAWRQLGQGLQALVSVRTALAQTPAQTSHTALPAPRGALRLEQVGVRFSGAEGPVLQGVTVSVEPGDIVGVVGPSGAGKTTLTRVMCGALRPMVGTVRLDGASLRDWDEAALGRHIGYAPQENALFAGTVAQNISRFQTTADRGDSDAGVVAAAQAAGAHELILKLPQGYDTSVGPGGRGLSAGQAQRIALARALFGDPTLIILDEPNAHLDQEGEAALVEALKTARARGAAIVVVAHRAGFMSIADKLIVMRDGKIDSFGPRDQVVARLAAVEGGRGKPPPEASRSTP